MVNLVSRDIARFVESLTPSAPSKLNPPPQDIARFEESRSPSAPPAPEPGEVDAWNWFSVRGDQKIYMRYDESSTDERPRMYVETYLHGEKKTCVVDIQAINPRNATRVEIYALFVHRNGPRGTIGALLRRLDPIDLAASSQNPLYTPDPTSNHWEERLDFVRLLQGMPQDRALLPSQNSWSDAAFAEVLQVLALLPQNSGITASQPQQGTGKGGIGWSM